MHQASLGTVISAVFLLMKCVLCVWTSEWTELNKEEGVSLFCAMFPAGTLVISVNIASFQDLLGWPKLVKCPHRLEWLLVLFFGVFNAVWDLMHCSGTSCFSCTSRHLSPQNKICLALAASSLSFMWNKWLVNNKSVCKLLSYQRGETWGGSTWRNRASHPIPTHPWRSGYVSVIYSIHPTIWCCFLQHVLG